MNMKKQFLTIMIFLAFALSITAQELTTCAEIAKEASSLVASAQSALTDGNTEETSSLLDHARLLLDDCDISISSETPFPNAKASPTSTSQTSSSGSFTVNIPAINTDNSIAFVRFSNISVDAGAIDMYQSTDNFLIVSNLNYGEATDFVPINAGELSFKARRSNTSANSEVLYEMRWNFVSNSSWIVTATGRIETLSFIVEPVSVVRNDYNEKARVRVVNLVGDNPRLTVTSDTGLGLGDGLGAMGIKDTMLEAGTYILQATTDDGANLSEAISFDFEENVTYTLYVIRLDPLEQPLHILNIVSPADTTYVLFQNNTDQAVDIYSRPGNSRLIENLPSGSESSWFEILSGSIGFITYAPDTGPGGQELAAIAVQLHPQRYVVLDISGNSINSTYESLTQP
jgi:hypothetical protein